jgi:hypothetical protein
MLLSQAITSPGSSQRSRRAGSTSRDKIVGDVVVPVERASWSN